MRFLTLFFGSLVSILLVIGIGYVGYVEVTSQVAADQVRSLMRRAIQLRQDRTHAYMADCRSKIDEELTIEIGSITQPLSGFRVRFVNPTKYVLEAVCATEKGPFLIESKDLPYGVRKIKGSGLMVPLQLTVERELDAQVLLEQQYRTIATGYVLGKPQWRYVAAEAFIDSGLDASATSCQGWGYQCCTSIYQFGQGIQESRVLDCPEHCFESCSQTPQVLFFNSNPLMDRVTRQLLLTGTEAEVEFGYEVIDPDDEIEMVTIDFGDGQREVVPAKGQISHKFSCLAAPCFYVVQILARDQTGQTLPDTPGNYISLVFGD